MIATSLSCAIWPRAARSAVSRNEQPSAKWINNTRNSTSADCTLRHRLSAPNSLALACQPSGSNLSRYSKSSPTLSLSVDSSSSPSPTFHVFTKSSQKRNPYLSAYGLKPWAKSCSPFGAKSSFLPYVDAHGQPPDEVGSASLPDQAKPNDRLSAISR